MLAKFSFVSYWSVVDYKCIDSSAVVVANISNNATQSVAIHGALARIHERNAFNSCRKAIHH